MNQNRLYQNDGRLYSLANVHVLWQLRCLQRTGAQANGRANSSVRLRSGSLALASDRIDLFNTLLQRQQFHMPIKTTFRTIKRNHKTNFPI